MCLGRRNHTNAKLCRSGVTEQQSLINSISRFVSAMPLLRSLLYIMTLSAINRALLAEIVTELCRSFRGSATTTAR